MSTRAGLPPGVRRGNPGARVGAFVIDWLPLLAVAAAAAVIGLRIDQPDVLLVTESAAGVLTLGWLLICWWLLATRGTTPGMRAFRLHLVGITDGRPVGWGRALLRAVVFLGCLAVAPLWLVLVILLLVDPLHRGWHDRAARGVVIAEARAESRSGERSPSDEDEGSVPDEDEDSDDAPPTSSSQAAPSQTSPSQSSPSHTSPRRPAIEDAPTYGSRRRVAGPSSLPAATTEERDKWGRPTSQPGTQAEPDGHAAPVAPDELTDDTSRTRAVDQGWWADLGDGRRVELGRLVLIGRSPTPGKGEDGAQLVSIGEDSKTVSKTHLAVGVDERGPWVMDRGSTNGSGVASGLGTIESIPAGLKVRVGAGQQVSYGEKLLTVRRD